MNRCTSKASYIELKESGAELTQAAKILGIIRTGYSMSLQEIMQRYREIYGNIELSSVSARCKKLKDDKQVIEDSPRKCNITEKTVNPLKIPNTCNHDRYRNKHYQQKGSIHRDIVWRGQIVDKCEDCGEDISKYRLMPVKTANEYIKGLD